MRGEASRIADRESRDSLAPKLRDTREDAWRIGNELFTITKVLDDSIQPVSYTHLRRRERKRGTCQP